MFNLQNILRENIRNLKPYSTARDEFKGVASIYLDANENPFDTGFNRYPDPLQLELKDKLSKIKGIDKNRIFLGNGSDEAIDVLYRAFCEPVRDNAVSISPTYGMYRVCADINNVAYKEVLLTSDFDIEAKALIEATDNNTKLIFLCSPNNPTGNSLNRTEIENVIENFNGIVVIDEAYIDFASQKSFLDNLEKFPNLVILQTFSKAWGLAGIRLGMAFAAREIIDVLNKIKYPYNINVLTQKTVSEKLAQPEETQNNIDIILNERNKLIGELKKLRAIEIVYPTDANFVLVKVEDAKDLYDYLLKKEIIVRNRSNVSLCGNSLRITVGRPNENIELINAISMYKKNQVIK